MLLHPHLQGPALSRPLQRRSTLDTRRTRMLLPLTPVQSLLLLQQRPRRTTGSTCSRKALLLPPIKHILHPLWKSGSGFTFQHMDTGHNTFNGKHRQCATDTPLILFACNITLFLDHTSTPRASRFLDQPYRFLLLVSLDVWLVTTFLCVAALWIGSEEPRFQGFFAGGFGALARGMKTAGSIDTGRHGSQGACTYDDNMYLSPLAGMNTNFHTLVTTAK